MKTNKTDKTDYIPSLFDEIEFAINNPGDNTESAQAALSKLKSEHAALVAVAEAGNDCREVLKMVSQNWREAGSMVDTMKRSAADFAEAQANLAAVREGGAK